MTIANFERLTNTVNEAIDKSLSLGKLNVQEVEKTIGDIVDSVSNDVFGGKNPQDLSEKEMEYLVIQFFIKVLIQAVRHFCFLRK